MEENKYLSYPEGYEQLAKDLDMPFEDINMRKMMLGFLLGTLVNN